MSILPAAMFDLDFFEPLPIQIEVSDAPLTSDAGLLPLRQFDERIGLTKQFAAVLDDQRDPKFGIGEPPTDGTDDLLHRTILALRLTTRVQPAFEVERGRRN